MGLGRRVESGTRRLPERNESWARALALVFGRLGASTAVSHLFFLAMALRSQRVPPLPLAARRRFGLRRDPLPYLSMHSTYPSIWASPSWSLGSTSLFSSSGKKLAQIDGAADAGAP